MLNSEDTIPEMKIFPKPVFYKSQHTFSSTSLGLKCVIPRMASPSPFYLLHPAPPFSLSPGANRALPHPACHSERSEVSNSDSLGFTLFRGTTIYCSYELAPAQ